MVTPSRSAASGATSRGNARSRMNRRRPARAVIAFCNPATSRIGSVAAVQVTTTSAVFSASNRSSNATESPSSSAANSLARWTLRLATVSLRTPFRRRARAVIVPVSPAPICNTDLPDSSPSVRLSNRTPIDGMEMRSFSTPVACLARRAVRSAAWKRRDSRGATAPASPAARNAMRTWPEISASPVAMESSPDATLKRCRAASTPVAL